MIWNFTEEPARFILVPPGCRVQSKDEDHMNIVDNRNPFVCLYDTYKEVLMPVPMNPLWTLTKIPSEETK